MALLSLLLDVSKEYPTGPHILQKTAFEVPTFIAACLWDVLLVKE
jgi:hypothetical protein